MEAEDIEQAADLQSLAFPPPFPQDLLWQAGHLLEHLRLFPEGQFVAEVDGEIVGSCSNTLISEEKWHAHGNWTETVGGPLLEAFVPQGSTMYGLDITVHPDYRRMGIGREFYDTRLALCDRLSLARYGTACRMPDMRHYRNKHSGASALQYAKAVVAGDVTDRTLTPLLRYGLTFLDVIENYMEDAESGNAAALLESAR
jgi:ribosomal protein S18 acetylase RimI-like enzyme